MPQSKNKMDPNHSPYFLKHNLHLHLRLKSSANHRINMTNFERIAQYLQDEGIPQTPQTISNWTGIKLSEVYETLQENKTFFRQIIKNESLIGYII